MSEGGIRRCLADAAQRGATLADIGGLIERYRREKPKCPAMHVGWLNRWISGESTPPDGELAPKPSARARDPSLAFEVERGRLVKRARALGVPESEIESACEQLRERLMGELADA